MHDFVFSMCQNQTFNTLLWLLGGNGISSLGMSYLHRFRSNCLVEIIHVFSFSHIVFYSSFIFFLSILNNWSCEHKNASSPFTLTFLNPNISLCSAASTLSILLFQSPIFKKEALFWVWHPGIRTAPPHPQPPGLMYNRRHECDDHIIPQLHLPDPLTTH